MSQAQLNIQANKVPVLISYSHAHEAMDELCRPFKYHVTHPASPSRTKIYICILEDRISNLLL